MEPDGYFYEEGVMEMTSLTKLGCVILAIVSVAVAAWCAIKYAGEVREPMTPEEWLERYGGGEEKKKEVA